jgi:hypothetical protein
MMEGLRPFFEDGVVVTTTSRFHGFARFQTVA